MKDPAVLFYIDKWFLATKEMKSDCRGWYLNLILHQYDKKSLPSDIEELANLADVRISEYEKFKQVFEQVLQHKFKLNSNGRLENDFVNEILIGREMFLDKRSEAGKKSYFYKLIAKYTKDKKLIKYISDNIDFSNFDLKNKQEFEQVFKHLSKLYISEDVNKGSIYKEQDWYKDFEIYKKQLRSEYLRLTKDKKYISERQRFHPNINIEQTLEKACKDFWSKEAGWKNKKNSKTVNIDWEATFNNALTIKPNQVYRKVEEKY